jgi:hypothetical protein
MKRGQKEIHTKECTILGIERSILAEINSASNDIASYQIEKTSNQNNTTSNEEINLLPNLGPYGVPFFSAANDDPSSP